MSTFSSSSDSSSDFDHVDRSFSFAADNPSQLSLYGSDEQPLHTSSLNDESVGVHRKVRRRRRTRCLRALNVTRWSWKKKVIFSLSTLFIYIFIGGAIFLAIEGKGTESSEKDPNIPIKPWSYLNALVFCVETICLIGFGDITPQSVGGKVFNTFYIISGVLIMGMVLGTVGEIVVDAIERKLRKHSHYWLDEEVLSMELQPIRQRDDKQSSSSDDYGGVISSVDSEAAVFSARHVKYHSCRFVWDNLTLVLALFLFFSVWLVFAIIFVITESWSFGESIYFCLIVLTTIGYGQTTTQSVAGRIFFMFFALLGLAIVAFLIRELSSKFIFRQSRKKKKMRQTLKSVQAAINDLTQAISTSKQLPTSTASSSSISDSNVMVAATDASVALNKTESSRTNLSQLDDPSNFAKAQKIAQQLRAISDLIEQQASAAQREEQRAYRSYEKQ